MTRRVALQLLLLAAVACGKGARPSTGPAPQVQETATSAQVDTLWTRAYHEVRRGKWADAIKDLERVLLELPPGDSRIAQAHLWLGEAQYATGGHLEAAREFRKASDDTPNDPLAPEALLRVGDVYADLWRRPELDPSPIGIAYPAFNERPKRSRDDPSALKTG